MGAAGSGVGGEQVEIVDGVLGTRHGAGRVRSRNETKTVALVGFGTVGQAVAKILAARDGRGLRLKRIVNRNIEAKRAKWAEKHAGNALPGVAWCGEFATALDDEIDVVVELIGGVGPAKELVSQALAAGKSVVTANKQLIAAHGAELLKIARESGAHLLFGAAVCGGMPVLPALIAGLGGDEITSVRGILNGTCNYILTRVEDAGVSFEDAVREAQQLGYAEADPTDDVDGYDARAKLAILARVALRRAIKAEEISTRPIGAVKALDFAYARRIGCTIRQMSYARRENGHVSAWVGPALVPLNSAEARLKGSQNVVVTTGEFGGENVFSGYGAGGNPTAVAVVSDVVTIASGGVPREAGDVKQAEVAGDFECPRFVRIVINDKPGVLAALAGAFSAHGINIEAVLQEPGFEKNWLPFVMTLDTCGEGPLSAAVEEVAALESVVEKPLALPVVAG